MCTLVLAWQAFAEAPVAVAANRDELVDRPATPPALVGENPRVVAPRDEEAGGTWMGYNEHGLFVGITNRWRRRPETGDRSRGLLVRAALDRASADDAARFVEAELRARTYQPFHLVLADAEGALVLAWDADGLGVSELEPGVHAVVNVGWDGEYFVPEHRPEVGVGQARATDRVRGELRVRAGETAEAWLDRAAAVLGDHAFERCIHGDGFGTRSSSLLALGDAATYEFADGPPCETDYRPVEVSAFG